ncbi:MAG: tetratricopeptide repeat protein [Desulfococcaceae bacterium]
MKTCAKFFFMAMAAGMMLAGCAYPPAPAQGKGPRPIYDENGRPLWIPPSSRQTVPSGGEVQSPTNETENGQQQSTVMSEDQTDTGTEPASRPAPRIGSAGSAGTDEEKGKAEDSNLMLAVSPLAVQAEQQMERGQLDQAFATAERAVRIDPDNAKMWNLMARIQFKKENYAQAEQLARKSNLLAANDTALQAVNWKIIAAVLSKNGQEYEARRALQKAEDLEFGRRGY